MSLNWPSNGEYFGPAYQVSALPYLTSSVITQGSVHKHEFPYITKFVTIANKGTNASDKICLSFTERGLQPTVGNYITLEQGETVSHEVRTTVLFVSCSYGTSVDYQLYCGLTTIPQRNFLVLSASNGHPGVG